MYKVEHVLRLLGFIQLILFFYWLLQYEYESVYSWVLNLLCFNFSCLFQKIPKTVVSSLKRYVDVLVSAFVTLESLNDGVHVITPSSYAISKQDGRMVLEKTSFNEFISVASFGEHNVVLITFKEHKDRSVSIVFQQLL